jgi:hypothetical protein
MDFAKFVVLFHPKSPVQNILQLSSLWTCLDIVIGYFLWLKISPKKRGEKRRKKLFF